MTLPIMTLPIRIAVLFFAFSVNAAMACKCASPAPTMATFRAIAEWHVNQTPMIFEGKVDGIKVLGWPIKPVAGETISVIPRLTVTFSAVHLYRGEITADVVIETGLGGGDCGFHFETGESYLVFAWKEENGRLTTNICSGTGLLEDAGTDLRLLRGQAPTAADLTDPRENISKSITPIPQVCGKIAAPTAVKLSSIEVVFWRAAQPEALAAIRYETAATHPDGSYCIDSLQPGKYLVGAAEKSKDEDEPSGRYFSCYPGVLERSQATEVEVPGKGKTVRVDFALLSRPLYSVQGYLRGVPEDSKQPIQIGLLSAVPDRFHAVEPAELGPHGFFEIGDVPPGRYIIFALTESDDGGSTFLSEGVELDVAGNIEGFKLNYVAKNKRK
jgi:hypothetical protein